jgi:hypothetical protein
MVHVNERAILHRVVKRLLPLFVALAVAASPVAVDVCQAACAAAMAHATRDSGHSCHADAPVNGPHVSHTCVHSGDGQSAPSVVAAQRPGNNVVVSLVARSNAAIASPPPPLNVWSTIAPTPVAPTALRSAIPLRI